MSGAGPITIANLAYGVHLNVERDADFPRRDRSRAAVEAWRRARTGDERVAAAELIIGAAHSYGLLRTNLTRH